MHYFFSLLNNISVKFLLATVNVVSVNMSKLTTQVIGKKIFIFLFGFSMLCSYEAYVNVCKSEW